MTAETSTRTRLGSQDGEVTSRNARTLLGLTMAETIRPKPKMNPEAKAARSFVTVSESDDVAGDIHSHRSGDEEDAGCGK
jgi:hypothetical protein